MSKSKSSRRSYLIDRPLQLSVVFWIVGIIAVVGVVGIGAILILPDAEQLEGVSGENLRILLLGMNAAHFILAAGAAAVAAILISHRVAGPSLVLGRAVEALREGRFDPRLTLREKDYLHSLADQLQDLNDHLKAKRDAQRELLQQIESCVDRQDLAGIKALLHGGAADAARSEVSDKTEAPVAG
jgi:hypothetical protein